MPFTHEQLGCAKGELNVLEAQDLKEANLFSVLENEALNEPNFDFREFLKEFHFSSEAKALFKAALELFKYYHANPAYENKNFNDSFYDITNAIMGKNPSEFKEYETQKDTRIAKVKTTKGTLGFSLKNLKSVVNSKDMPLFEAFFKARDTLARKINKELLEANLLLWERENIY